MICPCKGIPFRFRQFGKCSIERSDPTTSWPGLSRPSMTKRQRIQFAGLSLSHHLMDARVKPGHDVERVAQADWKTL